MPDNADKPFACLDDIPDDPESFGVVDQARLVGRFLWELTGRSFWRLVLVFVAVFLASFLPALLIILGMTLATQAYTRAGLTLLVVLCLVPISAVASFNYVAYRGLRDLVEKIGLGQQVGAAFVAYIDPSDRLRIPLTDFTARLKGYFKTARQEAAAEQRGVKGLFVRGVNAMVFSAVRFALNRIAKGCVVDGEVDLERFAIAVGERADGMLIAYFKKILWDLVRVILSAAVLVLWLLLFVVIQLINLIG